MTMRQTKWFGAALVGALAIAPAARADDSSQSHDRANTGSADTGSSARPSGAMSHGGSPVAATTASDSANDLLQRLHAGNQAEIEAGRWMQQHAQSDKVKDFAKKMVKDHQDMDKDVQKFAEKQGVAMTAGAASDPTAAKDRHDMREMEGMPAQQADRHYMTMMVNDHQRDVSEVRSAAEQARSSNDEDLAKLLDKTAKKMEDHLKDAQKIQRDLGSRQARHPSSR